MYHGVDSVADDPIHLFLSPEAFRHQMRVLRALGLRGVSLGELDAAQQQGDAGGLAGLTFDDAYRGVVEFALPVLEEHGFTATVFAVSGLTGGENVWDPPPRHRLMTEDDLRELVRRGVEVGSHSVSHARLAGMDPEEVRHEVSASRVALEELTGVAPRSFCYPYGSADEVAERAVRDAGYSVGCAVWRVAGLSTRLAMPRVGVVEQDRAVRFAAKLVLRGR